MVSIDKITEDDLNLVRELFFEKETVYVTKDARFEIDGDTIKCVASKIVSPESDEDLVKLQLQILRIKEMAEGIGYKFVDLRKAVNN